MQRERQQLGDLAARFFAYVQLKQRDTVKTGELANILAISDQQERDLLRRLARSGWIVRLRRGLYLVPPRIPAGAWSPGVYLALEKLMEDRSGRYQICGPSAFNYYGLSDQISNITYAYNNRISGERIVGNLRFVLIQVSDQRLGGLYTFKTPDGSRAVYCSKARTLMDAVYDWSRFDSLPQAYEWIRAGILEDPQLAGQLVGSTTKYGNQATIRRIGYLLDTLDQPPRLLDKLQSALNRSKALIPWIAGNPKRGRVNRAWGVVVND